MLIYGTDLFKTTPKNRKQTNKTKQQQHTNIKSIKQFFEQFQQQQQPTTTNEENKTTTTTTSKKSENEVNSRDGPAIGTRMDAAMPTKPKPENWKKPQENFENFTPLPPTSFPSITKPPLHSRARASCWGIQRKIQGTRNGAAKGNKFATECGIGYQGEYYKI